MASSPDSSPEESDEQKNVDEHTSPDPREIRLAQVSVTRTGHGVAMDIMAGKLRVRLYIDAQWADLVQNIAAGEGELDQLVPFRMAPLEIPDETEQVTPQALEARRIPELSSEHPLFGTPLWDAIFPSEEPPAPEPGLDFDDEDPSRDAPDESST